MIDNQKFEFPSGSEIVVFSEVVMMVGQLSRLIRVLAAFLFGTVFNEVQRKLCGP